MSNFAIAGEFDSSKLDIPSIDIESELSKDKERSIDASVEKRTQDDIDILDNSTENKLSKKRQKLNILGSLRKNKSPDKKEDVLNKNKDTNIENNKTSNLDISSETMNYNPDTKDLEAIGNAKVYFPLEDTTLYAEKIIFNYDHNTIRALNNVRILKDGKWMFGDYILVDLNYGNSLIEEPITKDDFITIKAQYSNIEEDKMKAYWGNVKFRDDYALSFQTRSFGNYFPLEKEFKQELYNDGKIESNKYYLKVKNIKMDRYEQHDVVEFQDADLYINDQKIYKLKDIRTYSDKERNYVEVSSPEVGSYRNFGLYAGYGYVFKLPLASTLKITPALVFDDSKVGFGVISRFMNKYNTTEFGYGTAKDKWIVRGKHNITDDLWINYGYETYIDDWFLGQRRPEYIAQLVHHKKYNLEDLEATFENRFNIAFLKDLHSNLSTFRGKWQTQAIKNFYTYTNERHKFDASLGLMNQTSLALYGTGDVQGILRFGPTLFTRYKNWASRISYFMGATNGDSPVLFDRYRYGKQAVEFTESLALCKYLSLAYSGTAVLSDDKFDGDLMQENKFYISIGPPYAKLSIGYDTKRQNSYFDFSMLVGTENNDLDFEYLEINDMNKKKKKNSKKSNQKLMINQENKIESDNKNLTNI